MISPLTGTLNANSNQITNLRFEVQSATQSVSASGRVYWQTSEGTLHIDTGTVMGRTPAITNFREGRLLATTNPTSIAGATTYGLLELGTGLSLANNVLSSSASGASILQSQIFS